MTDSELIREEAAIEAAYATIFEYACEAEGHVIDPKKRDALPDSAFGIVFTDANGKRQRKYPLLVKSDPKLTQELCAKAIQFFHYCKPEWKEELAKKIMSVVLTNKVPVKINKKSQIFKYYSLDKVPEEYVTETEPKDK